MEVVNFGLNGYSLAQSVARFEELRARLKYNAVAFTLVPRLDLWRDMNTLRYIAANWPSYRILPRFKLDETDHLQFVPGLYSNGSDVFKYNYEHASPELTRHLAAYDPFFIRPYFEETAIIGHSILFKIMATAYWRWNSRILKSPERMYDTHGRHLPLVRKIVERARSDSKADGASLVLIVLPVIEELNELEPGSPLR